MSLYARVLLAVLAVGTAATTYAEARQWYRGNTHAHTLNSDGDSAPDFVARWYREHGYQFLFITDHDYLTEVAPLNELLGGTEQFLLLPGVEVTQWSADSTRQAARATDLIGAPAHVNALFAKQVFLPIGERNCPRRACGANAPASIPIGETLKRNSNAIHAAGAVAQINHPNALWSLKPTDLAEIPDQVLIEVWNASDPFNLGGDDGAGDVRPSTEGFWDWLLSRGKIVWGVASDDSHHYKTSAFIDPVKNVSERALPGRAWIMVRGRELTSAALQTAITTGEFYASTGVTLDDISSDGTQLTIVIRVPALSSTRGIAPRYSTRFVGRDGKTLATVAGSKAVYRFKGSETYVRAVVTESSGKLAWIQPVFLDGRRRSP